MNGNSLSNRILGGAFAASVVINLGWVALVSHSGLFGAASSITQLHEKQFRVFKPIPQKPSPKHKDLPPPPPPKQKPPPKIQALKPVKVFKPLPQPKPPTESKPRFAENPRPVQAPTRPSQPVRPPVKQTIQVARTTQSTPHQISLPAVPNTPAPSAPIVPVSNPSLESPKTQPAIAKSQPGTAKSQPVTPTPSAPAEQPKAAVQPLKKVVDQIKPRVAEPKAVEAHRQGYSPVESQDAEPLGDFPSPQVPEDVDSIGGKTCVIAYTVDGTGHVRGAHVSHSCGSGEVDRLCQEIVQSMKFKPAIQDHYPQEASRTQPFSF